MKDVEYEVQKQCLWHTLPWDEALSKLSASSEGLPRAEAERRLRRFGENRLPETKSTTFFVVVLRQFRSPLIYILLVAAAISIGIGELKDAAFILGVLALNAGIGSTQEWKAQRQSYALKKLLNIKAVVFRSGTLLEIDANDVVPGDVVHLESGNRVPADVRLRDVNGLEIDESLLTGESVPVGKDPAWRGPDTAVAADQLNMAFAGSMVARGRGSGLVVATGTATGVGQLALEITPASEGKPPLLVRMERFANLMAWIIMLASVAIGMATLISGRYTLVEVFLFAVALAVAAIPEGLPVAMTVALAVATTRMAGRGVIVRRLTAVEGLGSCTFIGSDKTGTLTCNELTVNEIFTGDGKSFSVSGEGYDPDGEIVSETIGQPADTDEHLGKLLRAAALCNEASLEQRDRKSVV